jgi:transcriptional regulator with XRE-family HTH domain
MRQSNNEMTKNPVMLMIMKELQNQGKTGKELEEAIGLGNGAFSRWKYQKGTSYMNYLEKIAEFLNVTPEYLKNAPEKKVEIENLTNKEIEIIQTYRRMGIEERTCLLQIVKFLMNSSELRKNKAENESSVES